MLVLPESYVELKVVMTPVVASFESSAPYLVLRASDRELNASLAPCAVSFSAKDSVTWVSLLSLKKNEDLKLWPTISTSEIRSSSVALPWSIPGELGE